MWQLFGGLLKGMWNSLTGDRQIEQQNKANMELARYQTRMQEQFYNQYSSPVALMRQYEKAGLNPNLVYGSAAAGQGNVPSFSAPHVERNMSGADKVNKALSLIAALSGAATNIYQASAAREAAEQSAIKTISDSLGLRSQYNNFHKESSLFSMPFYYDPSASRSRNYWEFIADPNMDYFLSKDSVGARYIRAFRESEFNKLAKPVFTNYYDFGKMYDHTGNILNADFLKNGLLPYYHNRNKQIQLKYDLMNELGNMGTYGKLAVSLLGTIF